MQRKAVSLSSRCEIVPKKDRRVRVACDEQRFVSVAEAIFEFGLFLN